MFCNQCGVKNSDNAIFCQSCGVRIGGDHINLPVSDNYQKTPSKVFTSLILGIVSLALLFLMQIVFSLIVGVIGIIFGLVGMKEVTGSKYMGMARLAVLCNFISVLIILSLFMLRPA